MPGELTASRRAQSKLLISKLLDSRDSASPLTLIIDSLEQSAQSLWREYIRRAKINKTKVIFVSFETLRAPQGLAHFMPAHNLDPSRIQQGIQTILSKATTSRHLIILDTLHPLLSLPNLNITTYLPSLMTTHTSLLATYHSEQPLSHHSPYQPHPLILLKFLATTLLTTHCLSHILASKAARDRSVAAPVFGLIEAEEGTVQGLGSNDARGVVVECETRRKSGRATAVWFVIPHPLQPTSTTSTSASKPSHNDIILLEDHPLYRTATFESSNPASDDYGEVSFDLTLTEKQRLARERVELPYFDAQKDGGGSGEGGRILYDMGVEDDFDEEEDEI